MHDAARPYCQFRLAIARGVPSSQLSALLAMQRSDEPEIKMVFVEAEADALAAGLLEGRYDAGLSLQELNEPGLESRHLWAERMAVATSLRFPLQHEGPLSIEELLGQRIYRWDAERCPLLEQQLSRLSMHMPVFTALTSFETMALTIAAGFGVGVSAHSRIERAIGWGLDIRDLAGGPYDLVTYLLRRSGQTSLIFQRFERRALLVAKARIT